MTLPWVRLDTGWPRNFKTLALIDTSKGRSALVTYVAGLCYAGEQGTGGFIPRTALPYLHASTSDVTQLVEVGLWHEVNGIGWQVNDWADYQPSTEESEARSARAKWLNCRRWHGPDCGCTPKPEPAKPARFGLNADP